MANICYNTIIAEGTPEQVNQFIRQLSDTFDKYLHVDDNFVIGKSTSE